MFPFLRLAWHVSRAKRKPQLSVTDTCVTPMRVSLLDIDIFAEMNNGRFLTLMDIGRFEFSVRTGLWEHVRRNNWGFVVAGSSVRYRKRLHAFQRFEMHSKVVGFDERWFYFQQTMQRGDTWHCSALLRTAVVKKGKLVPTARVLEAMGQADADGTIPPWVQAWIDAEAQREWPEQ